MLPPVYPFLSTSRREVGDVANKGLALRARREGCRELPGLEELLHDEDTETRNEEIEDEESTHSERALYRGSGSDNCTEMSVREGWSVMGEDELTMFSRMEVWMGF